MSQFRIQSASVFVAKDANTSSVEPCALLNDDKHVVRSTGFAGPNAESPSCIFLVQLKRTFEGRHHSLQLAWETKRASQMLFDRRNNDIGHRSRLENRTDPVIDSRDLFGHRSFSPLTPISKLLTSSMSTRMSSPSTLIGNSLRQAFCGFTPDPLQTSNSQ